MGKDVGLNEDEDTIVLKLWDNKSELIMLLLILYSNELNMINSIPQEQSDVEVGFCHYSHIFCFCLELGLGEVLACWFWIGILVDVS